MRELSLFTGTGGGILGSKLLGWKTVGYVEWNNYCQRVIAQRINDGILDNAPIFSDIRAFIDQGYAARYRGLANVISAGFPCQPHSIAGKRMGGADDRDKWPETRECIRIIQPDLALLENVTGLLSTGYFGTIIGELSEIGYSCRWCVVSALSCGAPHVRERVWILAHSRSTRLKKQHSSKISEGARYYTGTPAQNRPTPWSTAESGLGRVAHGVANRVERLKAIGNGQVPAVVRAAWEILSEGIV